jgi:hypothetical protein
MTRKYHVFISATPEDLKNERLALERIIWELGHIPVCPDGLDWADKNDQRILKRTIGDCDYFLALVAHRCGLLPDGTSRTGTEYALAVQLEVPVLALVIGEKARWKASKKEQDPALIKALEDFKRKLQTHAFAFWNGMQDLRQNARELLTQELFLNPRNGWIPGDQLAGPLVANVMGRLVAENEELRRQTAFKGGDTGRFQEKMRHTLELLGANKISLSFFYTPGENWENTNKYRYLRLFQLLVPELYLGKTTEELSRFLGSVLNPDLGRTVRKDYPTPSNTIKKIMADFNLFKLVHYAGSGEDEVWELSPYGREIYGFYRLRQFEQGLKDPALGALPIQPAVAPVAKAPALPQAAPPVEEPELPEPEFSGGD